MAYSAPRPVILDTDPGGDDTVALIWLMALQRRGYIDLRAITTVGGNVSAEQTFSNASQLLALLNQSHLTLGYGRTTATSPSPSQKSDASYIHGADGLGNLSTHLPPATHHHAIAPDSADVLINQLSTHPHQITLIAIGPLSNLAIAEQRHPGILRLAQEIVIMGGALNGGNVTSTAEFNIWFDPDAAHTVFTSGAPLVLFPLDVTRRLVFTIQMVETQLKRSPPPLTHFLAELCHYLSKTAQTYRETNGQPGFLVHDAATIAYLGYPGLFTFQRAHIHIETQGILTCGQTVYDQRLTPQTMPNAWVAGHVDCDRFFTCLLDDLTQWLNCPDLLSSSHPLPID